MNEWLASQVTFGNLLTLAGLLISAGWHARRVVSVEGVVNEIKAQMVAMKKELSDDIGTLRRDHTDETEHIEMRRDADLIAIAQTYQRKDVQDATLHSINLQLTDIRSTLREIKHLKL